MVQIKKYQPAPAPQQPHQQNVQQQHQETNYEKMMRRFTRASAVSAIFLLIVGPLQSFMLVFLTYFMPAYVLTIGQYLSLLVYSNSTVTFFSFFLFIKNFRRAVRKMFGCSETQQITAVVAGQNLNAAHWEIIIK